jgi:hypothetical protein
LPSPPTPQERAEAKRRERAAREQARQEEARAFKARRWGGLLPDERVRRTNGALELARQDRELVDGIADLDPATQRAVAVWAARRACAAAGLTDLDWVKPALAVLERGESLPFADLGEAFRLLRADPHVRRTTVASYDGRHEHFLSNTWPCRHCGRPRPTTRWGLGWRPCSTRWSRSGSNTGASCPRCATRSPSWRNAILAVAGVVLGEPERLDDPQPHAAVVWLAQRSRPSRAFFRIVMVRATGITPR